MGYTCCGFEIEIEFFQKNELSCHHVDVVALDSMNIGGVLHFSLLEVLHSHHFGEAAFLDTVVAIEQVRNLYIVTGFILVHV